MSSSPFVGTATVEERLHDQNVLWKSIIRRVAYTLRVGIPGKIIAFNPITQYATIRPMINENIVINEVTQATQIPDLVDVLVILSGDSNWCITFPSLIGAECLILFADMCINAWSTNGPGVGLGGQPTGQNQEVVRRHDLSDGFAILSPRSQPNVIPNYSTTALEIRSMDNTVKISMTEAEIVLTIGSETITFSSTDITPSGSSLLFNTELIANSLGTKQTPIASSTASDHSVPIVLNGVTYYMRLSSTP